MDGLSYQQIKDLQQLIAPPKDDSDSDSDKEELKQRLSRQKISMKQFLLIPYFLLKLFL
jgi:hypothetical protein